MEKNCVKKFYNRSMNNNRDPVVFLSEIFSKVNCVSKLVAGVHNKCCFKVMMEVDGKHFSAKGTTLKMAKRSCALAALAKLCNIFYDANKTQPFVYVPNSLDNLDIKNVSNQNIENMESNKQLNEKNNLPLTIEEIIDDDNAKSKKVKKPKALQNITNFQTINSSKLQIKAKDSNLKTPTNNSNPKNIASNIQFEDDKLNNTTDLRNMLSSKLKSRNLKKKTLTNKTFSTMDVVNVQTMEMKFCVKSFARNPIESNDSNLDLVEEIINETEFKHQKQVVSKLKRRRDDSPESLEQPLAKRKATNRRKTFSKKTAISPNWSHQNENPLKVLKKLYPNIKFNLEAEMGSTVTSYFMMSALIGGRKFFGHGKTKYLAENDAALQILKHLEENPEKITNKQNNSRPQHKNSRDPQINLKNTQNNIHSSLQLPSHLADIMEMKIMSTFDQLTKGRQEVREYKVLAGIVMTTNMNFEDAVVVSLATGTKCVNGGNICCNGSVLNDSHAEIIAKRGLMKFLYTQLRWHCSPEMSENSIFRKNPIGLQIPYSLKENVHFHLYINTAPCGDARIFSFNHHNKFNKTSQTFFNSGQHGQLRTKVEGGMGTTPVGTRYYPQTWDGVVLGEPLLTMSCSDKIAVWNVVGIQGALLSQLIEPIYLHSIVLGSMFNDQHLYRAICGRIQHTLGYLPQSYRLNRPLLGETSKCLPRNTCRVPSLGINWTVGDNDIEIISLPTGRRIYNETSYLAKQVFFYKFNYLLNNLPNIGSAYMSNNYAEAKENAINFQMAKREVIAAFYRADLGTWVKKPIEQNEFYMN